MAKQIFINLPVKDLNRSMEFYSKLGYTFNPQFTDEKAACMLVGENIFCMLVVESYFSTFTEKEIIDAHKQVETLIALSAKDRAEVDDHISKVTEAGGKVLDKTQDYGWMYYRAYLDLDGHHWEIVYMDPKGPSEQ